MLRDHVDDPNGRLEDVVANWPTPAARDYKGANGSDHVTKGAGHLHQLPNFVEHLWYTPNLPNGGRTLRAGVSPTGMAPDGTKRQVGLETQARSWPTPTSLSFGESHQPGNSKSMNETLRLASSLPAPLTSRPGRTLLEGRRILNPLFVEWLMGWPANWTLVAWIDFACSATELCLWRQRMRSALLAIGLPREAPPAQLALFE